MSILEDNKVSNRFSSKLIFLLMKNSIILQKEKNIKSLNNVKKKTSNLIEYSCYFYVVILSNINYSKYSY